MARPLRQRRSTLPIRLANRRPVERAYLHVRQAEPKPLQRLLASVAGRWRDREPEVAVLATTTLILAIAAAFAGADLMFTVLLAAVAGAVVWAPWRSPE